MVAAQLGLGRDDMLLEPVVQHPRDSAVAPVEAAAAVEEVAAGSRFVVHRSRERLVVVTVALGPSFAALVPVLVPSAAAVGHSLAVAAGWAAAAVAVACCPAVESFVEAAAEWHFVESVVVPGPALAKVVPYSAAGALVNARLGLALALALALVVAAA